MAMRRVVVSVKGFYFQADVLGQPVTWLVPHALSQVRGPAGGLRQTLNHRTLGTLENALNSQKCYDGHPANPALLQFPFRTAGSHPAGCRALAWLPGGPC